jgi:hypothetical protein
LTRTKLQKLKEKLTYFYGRNFPIKYQEKFNFAEEWQGGERKEEKSLSERIQFESLPLRIVCLFIMLSNAFLVWQCSVSRVFSSEEETALFMPLMFLGLLNRLVAGGLKLYL